MTDAPTVIATLGESEKRTGSATTAVTGVGQAMALLEALTDQYSMKILSSTVAHGKTIDEICSERRIPTSTCYRKVKQLVNRGVLVVERSVTTPDGKRHRSYRSAFSSVRVEMKDRGVFVHVAVNPDVVDRLKPKSPSAQR